MLHHFILHLNTNKHSITLPSVTGIYSEQLRVDEFYFVSDFVQRMRNDILYISQSS